LLELQEEKVKLKKTAIAVEQEKLAVMKEILEEIKGKSCCCSMSLLSVPAVSTTPLAVSPVIKGVSLL
jgi:hypothetical protein